MTGGAPSDPAGRAAPPPRDALRPPETVARLARMGAFHQTRLSFVRALVRRMAREGWRIEREVFAIDASETGHARYAVHTPHGRYSFVVFARRIDPDERTDRVIAEAWDYTFALCEGVPDADDMARLEANVPRQEAGRMTSRELVLSRGNKSVRLFETIVDALARGVQPAVADIAKVGYLMRTTAVYGNGKFGLADYARLSDRGAFREPFSAQMLTVYVAREFSLDLVEELARQRDSGRAVALAPSLRRALGVGNATGLGMAPFLVSHPQLTHRWHLARETAIARVAAVPHAAPETVARFRALLDRARRHVAEWATDDARQQARIATLRADLATLAAELFDGGAPAGPLAGPHPWRRLMADVAARFAPETQELVNSLVLEPHPGLVDDLAADMDAADAPFRLDAAATVDGLIALIEAHYDWALALTPPERQAGSAAPAAGKPETPPAETYFWYRSETKEEPRLGERCCEPGADREMALGIGLAVQRLHGALTALDAEARAGTVAEFLMARPEWRGLVRRVQTLAAHPYAEVRDNLLGAEMVPIDLLRFKLSIFGAAKFDPKSDRWIRITLFQGAPTARELADGPAVADADDWAFPVMPPDPA